MRPRTAIDAGAASLYGVHVADSSALIEAASLPISTAGIPPEILAKAYSARRREIISESYPYPTKMPRRTYERRKAELQVELLKMQNWVKGDRTARRFAIRRTGCCR